MKTKLIILLTIMALAGFAVGYDMLSQPDYNPENTSQNSLQAAAMPDFSLRILGLGSEFDSASKDVLQNAIISKQNQKIITLKDINADIIILNFWAAWCSTCVAEIPDMLKLTKEFSGKVALVTISIDDKKSTPEKFLNRWRRQFPELMAMPQLYWLWDEHKELSLQKFNIIKVPETIIIDKNRLMREKIVGAYDWAGEEIRQKLNSLVR